MGTQVSYHELWLRFLQVTSPQWQNLEQRESYQRLVETVSVLHRLARRLSSRAELVGAVRQVRLHLCQYEDKYKGPFTSTMSCEKAWFYHRPLIRSVLVQTGETHEQGHRGDDAIRGEPEEDV